MSTAIARAGERPVIVLGFGDADPFAPAGRLLAEALPTERVLVVRGGHDWQTWKGLWHRILAEPEHVGLGP